VGGKDKRGGRTGGWWGGAGLERFEDRGGRQGVCADEDVGAGGRVQGVEGYEDYFGLVVLGVAESVGARGCLDVSCARFSTVGRTFVRRIYSRSKGRADCSNESSIRVKGDALSRLSSSLLTSSNLCVRPWPVSVEGILPRLIFLSLLLL